MTIGKKDCIFILTLVAVLGIFWAISGKERTHKVPYDDKHQQFYELFKQTGSKMDLDKGCPTCHNEQGGVPFPARHPLKPKDGPMRCTFCHKLIDKYK